MSEQDIKVWRETVAELSAKAPNTIIRDCLRAYDPSKHTNQIKKTLQSNFNKDTLGATYQYLSGNTFADLKKDKITELLIMKVKNYFPDVCQICNEVYCHGLNDYSFLSCHACGQEVHKPCYLKILSDLNLLCSDGLVKDIFKIPGIHFLCPNCQADTIIDDFCANHSDERKESPDLNNVPAVPDCTEDQDPNDNPSIVSEDGIQQVQEDISQEPRFQNPTVNNIPLSPNIIIDRSSKSLQHRTDFMKNKISKEVQNNESLTSESIIKKNPPDSSIIASKDEITSSQTNDEIVLSQKKPSVCKHYTRGKCKYGIRGKDCPYEHPKACTKLLKHGNKMPRGCHEGSKCSNFHPRMCATSIKNGFCYNPNCSYVHVSGTKRHREIPSVPSSRNDISHEKVTSAQAYDPTQDFLKMIHDFKRDMMQMMEFKLKAMLPVPPINYHTPPHFNQPFVQKAINPMINQPMTARPPAIPFQHNQSFAQPPMAQIHPQETASTMRFY